MTSLEELEFKTKLEEASKQIDMLWKCNKEEREKAVTLLLKIFGNILKSPDNPKFHSIKFTIMMKRFKNARPGLHILFAAGFSQTVDGSLIKIIPKYFYHLSQVLALLQKRQAEEELTLDEPELEKEPTPPPQLKPKSARIERKEEAKLEFKIDRKPQLPKEFPQFYNVLEKGAAIIVLSKYSEAKEIVDLLNGASIGEEPPIKVELFDYDEYIERFKNANLSIDSSDEEQDERNESPKPVELITNNIKISGLPLNIQEVTLEMLIKNAVQCTIKETYYKMKKGRGAALGGGATSEGDDLRSQIVKMKGNFTRITAADVEGKTKEEKLIIINEKKEQFRRDKAKTRAKEAREKAARERETTKAMFALKEEREQREAEEIRRQIKKDKERKKRDKARVLARIKAEKERKKKEQQERERARKGNY